MIGGQGQETNFENTLYARNETVWNDVLLLTSRISKTFHLLPTNIISYTPAQCMYPRRENIGKW